MKITVQSSNTVQPDYGGGAPPAQRTEAVALSVFDKLTFDEYVTGLYFFHPPLPPNSVLRAGFAKALAAYRVWAGRFAADADGSRVILLNDAGALFLEASADVALGSVMPLESTPEATNLHPCRKNVVEPLRVQVTRFACGSVVVGTAEHQRVGDDRTIVGFMVAWGQATRGVPVDPIPVLDRAGVFRSRDPPRVEFEHRGMEFKARDEKLVHGCGDEVVVHRVRFSREWMAELRSRASAPRPARPYSSLQCVVAHLWRCITRARRLDGRVATTARVAVDGRARMRRPRVPEGYAGNVVLWAHPTATAGELAARPLRHAAGLVSAAVARMDDGYFRSFIDFASSGAAEEERLVPAVDAEKMVLSPDIEVYSMVGFRFNEVNLGSGATFFHMRGYVAEEGLVSILPSLSGDGSIYAYVNLFRRDMDSFKNFCYSMLGADYYAYARL